MSSRKSVSSTASEKSSEIETSSAVRDTAERSKPRTIIGEIRRLFRAAAKAVVERVADILQPKTRRRRSGEDTRELFPRAWRRAAAHKIPASHATATVYLADTLDWLQLWHPTTEFGGDPASSYNASPTHFSAGGLNHDR